MAEPLRNPSRPSQTFGGSVHVVAPARKVFLRREPEYQAYGILKFAFTVAPIVAGFDKFYDLLVNWDNYLAPVVARTLDIAPHLFMQIAGIVEIIAGIGIAFRPRIFAYVVSAWLLGIIVNLILTGQYYDIALRDLGLCLGALALARLASRFDRRRLILEMPVR